VTPVAAPADKRFRRARVSPSRKARWRPSWRALARVGAIGLLVALGLYGAVDFVLASDALTVTRITVQGNQRMSRGEVLSLLEGLEGSSLMMVELETWRAKLLSSPWVAEAAIRRVFPGTVAVAISERRPMGIGRIKGALYLVDSTGAIIDEFGPNYADLDLPIVDGLGADGGRGGAVDQARAGLAGRVMTELQPWPSLAAQVSQIDVTDAHNAVVMLKGDTALLRIGDQHFSERLRSYLDLMPALKERIPDIDYVDLRFGERVYVRPQASGRRNQRPQASGPRPQKAPGG
jgi:cell division protein FtsQ